MRAGVRKGLNVMLKKWLLVVLGAGVLLGAAGCGMSADDIITELQKKDAEMMHHKVDATISDESDAKSDFKEADKEVNLEDIFSFFETQGKEQETLKGNEEENSPEESHDSNENNKDAEYVTFGAFEQDNNPANGKEEIEWLVLEKENGEMLLISRYILDANTVEMYYDIWENRPLRSWLNNEFYNTAFSEEEKSKIVKGRLENPDNEGYFVSAGATEDNVFLLSVNEAKYYFGENDSVYGNSRLTTRATEYAIARGVGVNMFEDAWKGNSAWDLRSNGYHQGYVAWVSDRGDISDGGSAQPERGGIRPAIRIRYMSEEEAERELYGNAMRYFENGDYVQAEECLMKMRETAEILEKINECRYRRAKELYDTGEFGKAKVLFSRIEGYKDADKMRLSAEKEEIKNINVGESYVLGAFEQDNNEKNGAEPIEWQVLEIKDGRMLLISKYVLDAQMFDDNWAVWENSYLRNWLKNDFYETAFSTAEKTRIIETELNNSDSYLEPDDVSAETKDKVFLLSVNEAVRYFGEGAGFENESRTAKPTAYAIARGVNANGSEADDIKCWWHLRSNGVHEGLVEQVNVWGQFVDINKSDSDRGVRPAVWITLE